MTNRAAAPAESFEQRYLSGVERAPDEFGSKYITRLYDTQNRLDELYQTQAWMRQNHDPDLKEYQQDNRTELNLRPRYDADVKSEGQINSRIRAIENSTSISSEDKAARIRDLQNRRADLARQLDVSVRATQ